MIGSSCYTQPKRPIQQKNPEKHPEDPPEMHALQGSHTSNHGGTQSRATARTTPNNGYPQQEGRANTTPQSGKTFIKKASDKIQSLLDASSIQNNDSTVVEQVRDTSASVGLLRQQWFPRWPKSKDEEYHRRPAGAKQAPSRRVPKAGRWITGFSLSEFSPHMYIRSSPRGPSRDLNRTLSKE